MSTQINAKVLATGSIMVVIASIIAGLIATGTPGSQRQRKMDDRRVFDLSGIVRDMGVYWERHKVLPPSLAALSNEPGLHTHLSDPQTGAAYEYVITGEKSFHVCAIFAAESMDESQKIHDPASNWLHGSGHQCFERTFSEAHGARAAFE